MRPDEHVPGGTEPEPPDSGPEPTPKRGKRDLGGVPSRDVPEPPNRDEVRPDDEVTPDAGPIEPPG
ncbi:hypothetical protein [Saccharomonospora glauca]|jgi:hypothetical protein|uniref:Uncharacterized protein n=1 Tax=Saccharomonospora glauca K62 TaxID=928724 RepID=I1D4T3_9PSEU|nr:hypothetical protein [Saccharomonospora glauca]EIE99957.1 hypothetical protein SacglDRAFT_03091 [Saccharomonospora glauca K62]